MSTIRFVIASFAATLFSASVLAESAAGALGAAPVADASATARLTAVGDPAAPITSTRSLRPRTPIEKIPSQSIMLPINLQTGAPLVTGRVLVKFRDEYKVRAARTPSPIIQTVDGVAMTSAMEVLHSLGGGVAWQAIEQSDDWIKRVEERAATRSGEAAPDIAGIIYVAPKGDDLVACARAFNDLPEVEFAVIEQMPVQAMGGPPPAVIGQIGPQTGCNSAPANCFGNPGPVNCNKPACPPMAVDYPDGRCTGLATVGSACSCCAPEVVCGEPCPDGGPPNDNCALGCNFGACCSLVSSVIPACGQDAHGWDGLCAAYANAICPIPGDGFLASTVYDTEPPMSGSLGAVPASYKFDPCFALRTSAFAEAPDNSVQSRYLSELGLPPTVNFPFELVQITSYSTNTVPPPGELIGNSGLVTGVAATGVNPAFPANAQFAMQDPSFERAPYQMAQTCFTISPNRVGCNNSPCCTYVCLLDPSCCTIGWDATCVGIASQMNPNNPCVQPLAGQVASTTAPGPADFPTLQMAHFPGDGATPDFTPRIVETGYGPQARNLQTWSVAAPVAAMLEPLPLDPQVGLFAVAAPTNQDELYSSRMFLNTGYRGGGLDLPGYDAAASALGISTEAARGEGVTIGVIDNSCFVNHEELAGNVTVEPGYQPILTPLPGIDPHHGTAVFGILMAKDDGQGITGVAPNAKGIFFPAIAGGGVGSRLFNAMASAIGTLVAGDVLCIPLDFPTVYVDPVTGGVVVVQGTVLQSPDIFLLATVASQIGISTVVAAGNECAVVRTAPGTGTAPTSTITVGACTPGATRLEGITGPARYQRCDFSNYFRASDPIQAVDVAGWGTYVTTCGYGDLWRGHNSGSTPEENDNLRTYTIQFGGTSAAAAMVAGCVARLQASAKALFGTPMLPQQVKSLVRLNVLPQSDGIPAISAPNPCYGDTGGGAENETNLINGFINMSPIMLTQLTTEIICIPPPNIVDTQIQVLVGQLISGSSTSICALDGSVLRLRATRGSSGVSNPTLGPSLLHPTGVLLTDVMVTATTSITDPAELYEVTVGAVGQALPPANVYTIFYIYNVPLERWLMLPTTLQFFAVAGGVIASGPVSTYYNVANLVDWSSGQGKIRIRAVTIAPAITSLYETWWDSIVITPNPPLEPPPPCWLAREVYGADDARWLLFREWLDHRAPPEIREAYDTFAKPVAAWIAEHPTAKALLRPLLDTAIERVDEAGVRRALQRFAGTDAARRILERAQQIDVAATTRETAPVNDRPRDLLPRRARIAGAAGEEPRF